MKEKQVTNEPDNIPQHILKIWELRDRIDKITADIIFPGQPFALLDFPDHSNIGDSAIYEGEMSYLHARAMFPSYVSTFENYNSDKMRERISGGQILLHGGGNFGDIWPRHQTFREDVLKQHKGRPIVQLPQTIYFSSQKRLDESARIIESHGAFTLLVRDQRSYDLVVKSFQCDVRLCPDKAFHIGPIHKSKPQNELLIHLREDKEAATDYNTTNLTNRNAVIREDWPFESAKQRSRVNRAALPALAATALKYGRPGIKPKLFERRAKARFDRGIEMLQNNRYVITNRMHGHIMCLLLGIPHCVIDNSYGKTSGFMQTWNTQVDSVYIAANVQDAVKILSEESTLAIGT